MLSACLTLYLLAVSAADCIDLKPIVIIPDYGESTLVGKCQGKCKCSNDDTEVLFELDTEQTECQKNELEIIFDRETNTFHNKNTSIIIESQVNIKPYEGLIKHLKTLGYQLNDNLFITHYDWRNGYPSLPDLKEKIVLIGLGYGGILANEIMNNKGQKWTVNNIDKFISINTQWEGDISSLKEVLKLEQNKYYMHLLKRIQRYVERDRNRRAVIVGNEIFNVDEIDNLLLSVNEIGYTGTILKELYNVHPLDFINHTCLYSGQIVTPEILIYDSRKFGEVLSQNFVLGDGIASSLSMSHCQDWTRDAAYLGKHKRREVYNSKDLYKHLTNEVLCGSIKKEKETSIYDDLMNTLIHYYYIIKMYILNIIEEYNN